MTVYRLFLRTSIQPTDVSIDTGGVSEREEYELTQRMLEEGGNIGGHAEAWIASRFVGIVPPMLAEDIGRPGGL